MISHHHKCIFVHIPKNAGQSIESVFLNEIGLSWQTRAPLLLRHNSEPKLGPPRLAHLKACEYVQFKYLPQTMFDEYFKFSFVRNPWTRVVSFYKFLNYHYMYTFHDFVHGPFKQSLFNKMHWFVGPQSEYLYSADGELIVDFVGRFERLQSDFNIVCDSLGIKNVEIPHVNSSKSKKKHLPLRPDKLARTLLHRVTTKQPAPSMKANDYYNQETIDTVASLYADDIAKFGYDFE